LREDLEEATAELERLQKQLESRDSISCFAHSGVSFLAALILACASAKLFWDSVRVPILGFVTAAVSLILTGYAVRRYLKGRKMLKQELAQFESLKALRRVLCIDDPSAQLRQ
jgi:hypothetical protein